MELTAAIQALNASSIFQGTVGGIPTVTAAGTTLCGSNLPGNVGFQCAQQRFDSTLSGSIFADQNYLAEGFPIPLLPFTLPTASNFRNGYSAQGSLTVERQFAGSSAQNAALFGAGAPYPLGPTPVHFADEMSPIDWQLYCEAFA